MNKILSSTITYKRSLRLTLHHVWPTLIFLILIIFIKQIFAFFEGYEDSTFDDSSMLVLRILLIFFIAGPVFVLHLSFLVRDMGKRIDYNLVSEEFKVSTKSQVLEFTLDEVDRVISFKSPELAEDRTQWLLWSSYNYSYIILKDGSEIFVSSLLVPNLDLPIDESKKQTIKTLFPFPRKYVELGSQDEQKTEIPDVFKRNTKNKTDNELQEIISNPKGYGSDFIRAAKEEMERRESR